MELKAAVNVRPQFSLMMDIDYRASMHFIFSNGHCFSTNLHTVYYSRDFIFYFSFHSFNNYNWSSVSILNGLLSLFSYLNPFTLLEIRDSKVVACFERARVHTHTHSLLKLKYKHRKHRLNVQCVSLIESHGSQHLANDKMNEYQFTATHIYPSKLCL